MPTSHASRSASHHRRPAGGVGRHVRLADQPAGAVVADLVVAELAVGVGDVAEAVVVGLVRAPTSGSSRASRSSRLWPSCCSRGWCPVVQRHGFSAGEKPSSNGRRAAVQVSMESSCSNASSVDLVAVTHGGSFALVAAARIAAYARGVGLRYVLRAMLPGGSRHHRLA